MRRRPIKSLFGHPQITVVIPFSGIHVTYMTGTQQRYFPSVKEKEKLRKGKEHQ